MSECNLVGAIIGGGVGVLSLPLLFLSVVLLLPATAALGDRLAERIHG